MKLIVIYGAPGVGKLTTATAVSTLTGLRLFHNHLSFNLANAVFEFPTPPFLALMETVRLATFEAAARERLAALVFTFVYAAPDDDGFVQRMIEAVEGLGGELGFVRLSCDAATNEARVVAPDRARLGKLTDVAVLRREMARWNVTSPIPFRASLEIDNSKLDAHEVARRIAAHFALPIR
ncbi:MAG TPA: shikimate kinase [Methylomirabilota bacterium]|nr:shikimate kinase [Methylomirabilota bacterium]